MNLFELFVKIGVDDQASKNISNITTKLGNGLKTAAKVGTAAVTTAAAGITALTTAAVNNYAEFEQLVGGAELMFRGAYETVMQNAQEAYRTVQMSQNEYLRQVNGFATGLKTALGGNEEAAAALANRIIQAEADIVAATGNTQEAVQNAFNGIMKSNFTMLDNLQIGITPTKEGFQEVIDKVNEWNAAMGNATNYQMGNLADMQSALVDYIDMQGLAGYAAAEASKTISGSVASMKAAWSNLVTGIADENANIKSLVNDLVITIVGDGTESNLGVFGNILPAIKTALNGAAQLVNTLFPVIVQEIPAIINENLPLLATAAVGIIESLIDGISSNQDQLFNTIFGVITFLSQSFISMLPQIVTLGLDLIVSLIKGIVDAIPTLGPTITEVVNEIIRILSNPDNIRTLLLGGLSIILALVDGIINSLPELIPAVFDIIFQIVDTLTNPDTLANIINVGLALLLALVTGLLSEESINSLIDTAFALIDNLLNYLLDPENITHIVATAVEIVVALTEGLLSAMTKIGEAAKELGDELWKKLKEIDWLQLGKDLISSIYDGLVQGWQAVAEWFSGALESVKEWWSDLLNPDEEGSTVNERGHGGSGGSFKSGLDYVPYDGFVATLHKGERILTAEEAEDYNNTPRVQITQNIYSQAQTAADLMEEALYEQERAVLMGV